MTMRNFLEAHKRTKEIAEVRALGHAFGSGEQDWYSYCSCHRWGGCAERTYVGRLSEKQARALAGKFYARSYDKTPIPDRKPWADRTNVLVRAFIEGFREGRKGTPAHDFAVGRFPLENKGKPWHRSYHAEI